MKKTEPKVKAFSITIEVPIHDGNLVLASWSIPQWESLFISYRDNTHDPELREQYDVCRATLKWASACGATAVKLSKPKCGWKVEFTFTIENLESLLEFEKGLKANVSGAVM